MINLTRRDFSCYFSLTQHFRFQYFICTLHTLIFGIFIIVQLFSNFPYIFSIWPTSSLYLLSKHFVSKSFVFLFWWTISSSDLLLNRYMNFYSLGLSLFSYKMGIMITAPIQELLQRLNAINKNRSAKCLPHSKCSAICAAVSVPPLCHCIFPTSCYH